MPCSIRLHHPSTKTQTSHDTGKLLSRWVSLAAGAVVALSVTAHADSPATNVTNNAALKAIFTDFIRPGQPGCGVGLMRDGDFLQTSAFGSADLATREQLDESSVFNVASISKQFTAYSILLLDQRKALSIDDPLTKYVPELTASARGVTLRHLIHHTGGLRDYTELLMLRGRRMNDGATQFETIQMLGRQQAANAPPGTEFSYSNTGYLLLATVIERVSGRSMKQFAAENIFEPLNMRHTTIIDRYPAGLPRLARGYAPASSGFDIDESAAEQVGDGQVHSTTADLLLWADNLVTGRVGGALVQRMRQVGMLNSGKRIDYAAGVGIGEYNGLPTIGHSGGWAGYASYLLIFPQQRFAVSVLCNRNDASPGRFANAIANIYLADEMSRTGKKSLTQDEDDEQQATPATTWRPGQLSSFEGVYWSEEAEARCVLLQRNGQLFVEGCMPGYKLQPSTEQEFYAPEAETSLRFHMQGSQSLGFSLISSGLNGLAFKRQ